MIHEWSQMIVQSGKMGPSMAVWVSILIRITIVATVYLAGISLVAMFCIWWECKAAGHMQSRLGPKHVGPYGLFQSLADGIKLILKEDLMPSGADGFLFRLAPYLAFAPVFAAFLALPFSNQFVFEAGLNIGVLYLLAVLAVEVLGVILAGWGSNSKWAVFGAMREACQMVSYEIPLGISIICGVLVAGTLDMVQLSYLQGRGIWGWFIFHNPFIFIAFILYFVASLASNKCAPFDLPESESELVAGFHTEYSGLRFSFFFFAEYAAMFVVGGIQAALFLGGWNSPLNHWFHFDPVTLPLIGKITSFNPDLVYWAVGYDPVAVGGVFMHGGLAGKGMADLAAAMGLSVPGLVIINLYGMAWFVAKAMTIIFVQMWLRWTLPRIRIDQVLYACVKVLLPMSLVTLAGTAAWVALVPQPAGPTMGTMPDAPATRYWGHLLAPQTPLIQWVAQIVMTAIGVGIVLYFCGIVLRAWSGRDQQPRKTLFDDVMPVGNQISFTTGAPAPESAAAPAVAAPEATAT